MRRAGALALLLLGAPVLAAPPSAAELDAAVERAARIADAELLAAGRPGGREVLAVDGATLHFAATRVEVLRPGWFLTAAAAARVNKRLKADHQAVADLAKRNEVLEAETLERGASSSLPVAIALAVGAVLGAGATFLLTR